MLFNFLTIALLATIESKLPDCFGKADRANREKSINDAKFYAEGQAARMNSLAASFNDNVGEINRIFGARYMTQFKKNNIGNFINALKSIRDRMYDVRNQIRIRLVNGLDESKFQTLIARLRYNRSKRYTLSLTQLLDADRPFLTRSVLDDDYEGFKQGVYHRFIVCAAALDDLDLELEQKNQIIRAIEIEYGKLLRR